MSPLHTTKRTGSVLRGPADQAVEIQGMIRPREKGEGVKEKGKRRGQEGVKSALGEGVWRRGHPLEGCCQEAHPSLCFFFFLFLPA